MISYDDDDVDDGILSKSFANIAMKIMAAPKIKAQSLSPVSGSLQYFWILEGE